MDFREYVESRGVTAEMIEEAHRITLERIEAYNLAQVRKERHITQKELAETMHVAQSRISQIENGDISSAEVGTVRKYVEALGARLVMSVEWPDKTITLA